MSDFFLVLTGISITGLLAVAMQRYGRNRKPANLAIGLSALAVFGIFLYTIFNRLDTAVPKGDDNSQIYFVIVLYFFMVLGMLASHGYTRFSKTKEERGAEPFDFWVFIAPVFASPLVFIPLLAAFQNVAEGWEKFTSARMMTFLVAFQNGFFWKEYFDKLKKEKRRGSGKKRK